MPNCGACSSADHASPASVRCRKSPPLRIRSTKADSLSIPALERDESAGIGKRGDVRMNDLKKLIREVPDYPKPGILFYSRSGVPAQRRFRSRSKAEEAPRKDRQRVLCPGIRYGLA